MAYERHYLTTNCNVLKQVARAILSDAQTPDLSHTWVILPSLNVAPLFRQELILAAKDEHQWPGILGPNLTTLPELSRRHASTQDTLNGTEKALVLFDVIRNSTVYQQADPWAITEQLLSLFDELEANQATIHVSRDTFADFLIAAYQINEAQPADALFDEAYMVHQLWLGWRQQHKDEDKLSTTEAYIEGLSNAIGGSDQGEWHLVEPALLSRAEQTFLHSLAEERVLHHWQTSLHSDLFSSPPNSTHQLFAAVHALQDDAGTPREPLLNRASSLKQQLPNSPIAGPDFSAISIAAADSHEHEALMVSLQVRQWWLAGIRNIGIISLDRRLTRRVRALLDRAHISIRDYGGWALSTTSAATVLDRLLQTIEQHFAYQPLLDLLKSPFIALPDFNENYQRTVYRFEREIVRYENIAQDLYRYQRQVERRAQRLQGEYEAGEDIAKLLRTLDSITAPLQKAQKRSSRQPGAELLNLLSNCMKALGIYQQLQDDLAGKKLLETLDQLHLAAQQDTIELTWSEFRTWLGRTLESTDFMPPHEPEHVAVMSLEQSSLWRFDRIMITGANMGNLPAAANITPFFNDAVRHELGLSTVAQTIHSQHARYLTALQAAPEVIVTYTAHSDQGSLLPSPWVELLEQFHKVAFGQSLYNASLPAMAWEQQHDVVNRQLPTAAQDQQPKPVVPISNIPKKLSASAHDTLIRCPYQYFAGNILALRAPESVRELLSSADYGSIIHHILELFHSANGWQDSINELNAELAINALVELSKQEFSRALEQNVIHTGWLQRWLGIVPDYIQWQIQQEQTWRPNEFEYGGNHSLGHFHLTGKVDRIDHEIGNSQIRQVIDYKTGSAAKQHDIEYGEANQLLHYATLAPAITSAKYLLLNDQQGAKETCVIEQADLDTLTSAMQQRLKTIQAQLAAEQHGLPAWDNEGCQYCDFAGLCRINVWREEQAK